MKTQYTNYFFDLDDTLLDFKESEKLSFKMTMDDLGVKESLDDLFKVYKNENDKLWLDYEKGLVTKDILKVKRFKILFDHFSIEIDPNTASKRFLDALPESVVLMESAVETLEWLSGHAEVGIITNGIEYVQLQRINNSPLKDFISYICVSDSCGHAKPDVRFFEYTAKHAKNFNKSKTLVVGDRYDADIIGANRFGVDSCWFNHDKEKKENPLNKFEIYHLDDLKKVLI